VALSSEDPKVITHLINFELVQFVSINQSINATVSQRYGETDRRTDGRLTIAIPRFALRASRGKNAVLVLQVRTWLCFVARMVELMHWMPTAATTAPTWQREVW